MKEIPLTQGYVALVDDADFKAVSMHSWCVSFTGKKSKCPPNPRAYSRIDGRLIGLHNFLLGTKSVDHRDGNALDNQRKNLRKATKKQNNRAFRRKTPGKSSQFRGVCFDRARNKWLVSIEVNEKQINLGRFLSEIEAAKAYDAAARKYFGDFAAPNFI